ncbi:aldo/keto reductase [Halarchaeum sp. CBA1220]|uniref:aldo/keto reductase n=1 Tax=Halarchaeum sp. CBA1220 TaxID=1853682 RepID=UPI000F3A8C69|nr:aldo/keto reductase [Halarchaeum sp. CBA1220]QLC34171.1 aldo/keto reductase [Halarchaeum sp. CBA1220]
MDEVPLGTTGETVSPLCLGTMYFGSRTDPETSRALLDTYYDAGGRFLDTANIYATWVEGYDEPESEPLLGEWMTERDNRDDLFLATKVGFEYGDVPKSLDPDVIEREVERSLERLDTDYIDLLYAHVDDRDTPLAETMAAFDRLVESGKVRHLGASNYYGWRLARANTIAEERGLTPFSCVQPRFSYLTPHRNSDFERQRPATDESVTYCDDNDLTMLPYSPLLGGCYGRADKRIPERYVTTENRLKMDAVADVAERHDVSGNQVALAWLTQRDPPTVPVVGCSTVEQLEENLAALDVDLDERDFERLDGIETLGGLH